MQKQQVTQQHKSISSWAWGVEFRVYQELFLCYWSRQWPSIVTPLWAGVIIYCLLLVKHILQDHRYNSTDWWTDLMITKLTFYRKPTSGITSRNYTCLYLRFRDAPLITIWDEQEESGESIVYVHNVRCMQLWLWAHISESAIATNCPLNTNHF